MLSITSLFVFDQRTKSTVVDLTKANLDQTITAENYNSSLYFLHSILYSEYNWCKDKWYYWQYDT